MAREMKDSGVEWIGKIPREWEVKRLKNILLERKENNNPIKTKNILSLTNDRGVIPYSEKGNTGNKSKEDLTGYKIAYPNDIVLNSMNIVIGSVGLSKYYGCVSPVYYMLYSENNRIEYYNYIFQTRVFQTSLKGLGNGILDIRMRIPMEKLNNVILPIPPLEEQEKIANYLDKKVSDIDLIIEKTRATIEDYKKYKQSIITEAVTKGINPNVEMKDSGVEWIGEVPREWEVKKLKYVAQLNPKIDMDHLEETSEVTFTPMEKIKNGYFINNKGIWGNNNSSYTNYSENDIVMAKVTPCFENGNIAIMKGLYNNIGFGSSELFVFRSNKNIKKEYLFYFLRNEIFKNLGKNNMTGVGGLKRVSSEFILNFNVSVPPLEEQNQIAEYLDKKTSEIDTLITKKEALIAELEEYKKSLIYECVTGKKEIK